MPERSFCLREASDSRSLPEGQSLGWTKQERGEVFRTNHVCLCVSCVWFEGFLLFLISDSYRNFLLNCVVL